MPPKQTTKAEKHAKNEVKRQLKDEKTPASKKAKDKEKEKKKVDNVKEKEAELRRAAAQALRAGSSSGGLLMASLRAAK